MKYASLEDLNEISEFSNNFIKETVYKNLYDVSVLENLIIDLLLDANSVIILDEGRGMLAGRTAPFLFGFHKVAMEVGWWVEPEYRKTGVGKNLIDAFEYWAKNNGCSLIVMVSLDDAVGKYYEKTGYKLVERTYMKEI